MVSSETKQMKDQIEHKITGGKSSAYRPTATSDEHNDKEKTTAGTVTTTSHCLRARKDRKRKDRSEEEKTQRERADNVVVEASMEIHQCWRLKAENKESQKRIKDTNEEEEEANRHMVDLEGETTNWDEARRLGEVLRRITPSPRLRSSRQASLAP